MNSYAVSGQKRKQEKLWEDAIPSRYVSTRRKRRNQELNDQKEKQDQKEKRPKVWPDPGVGVGTLRARSLNSCD